MIEDSPTEWTTDLYVLATRGAGVPATQVMVSSIPQHDDEPSYADIICTLAVADDIANTLAAEDYRFKKEHGTSGSALRVRIRVFRD